MKIPTTIVLLIIAIQFSSVKGVGNHDNSESECVTCHADKTNGAYGHFIESSDDCVFCHELVGTETGTVISTASPGDVCVACHAEQDVLTNVGIHSFMDCTDCHSPHASSIKNRYITLETELCGGSCHGEHELGISHPMGEDVEDKNKGGALSCVSSCHEVHEPAQPKMLQMADLDICYQCHDDKF